MHGIINASEQSTAFAMTANTSGLKESSTPYQANLNLSVASQRDKLFSVPVLLFVSATTSARASMWGTPADGRVCTPATSSSLERITHRLGDAPPTASFTACDVDGLAVDHDDSQEFHAVLRSSAGENHTISIRYVGKGRYELTVVAPYLGEFSLGLMLTAPDGSAAQVGGWRDVVANCSDDKVVMPDGRQCGCDAGAEPVAILGTVRCAACKEGYRKTEKGNEMCEKESGNLDSKDVAAISVMPRRWFPCRCRARHLARKAVHPLLGTAQRA